jgi:hypothetical protein
MADNLKYYWKVILDDDSEINQFVDSIETPYSEVIAELSSENVKEFRIIEQLEDTPNVYCVDLVNYKFYKGTIASPHAEDVTPGGISGTGRANLIYRRRNQIRIDETGHIVNPPRMTFILGLRISDTSYTLDVRAAVGALPEEYTAPRETDEMPI